MAMHCHTRYSSGLDSGRLQAASGRLLVGKLKLECIDIDNDESICRYADVICLPYGKFT